VPQAELDRSQLVTRLSSAPQRDLQRKRKWYREEDRMLLQIWAG
jgi:hypothetical protein